MKRGTSQTTVWRPVGDPKPHALREARLQLHWASQIAAAAPFTFLDAAPDFSHVNLGWDARNDTLWARPVGQDPAMRVGIRFEDLALVLVDSRSESVTELPLGGRTLEQGYEWLEQNLKLRQPSTFGAKPLERLGEDFPDHPLKHGALFSAADPEARKELARWFANADLLLSDVVARNRGASPVRCWPHHFDIATLITLATSDDPEQSRTVGVGMTPGDEYYNEPYFYVTPWPYPDKQAIESFNGAGSWHTEGWIGAVLTGTQIVTSGNDLFEQAAVATGYLEAAIPSAIKLTGTLGKAD